MISPNKRVSVGKSIKVSVPSTPICEKLQNELIIRDKGNSLK
jgi:hypothetical protein